MVSRGVFRGLQTALPLLLVLFGQSTQQHAGVEGVAVELNGALARSYAEHDSNAPLTFSSASEPLPANILMTLSGYYGDTSDRIPCSVSETKRERGETVTVLLAISKCLNESALNMIESWVADMKDQEYTYFQDGVESPIEFATTVVPGNCQEWSEHNKRGLNDPVPSKAGDAPTTLLESSATASLLLSTEVLEGDLARVASFARFGRVLDALPSAPDELGHESVRPIAVVSFVNNERSFEEVEQYERTFHVTKAFNFQLCGRGENACVGKFEHCIVVHESVELVLYNLFKVTQSYTCDALELGVPVSYVDPANARQCFCACPAGFERQDGANGRAFCAPTDKCATEPSCAWNTHPYGFKHEVTTKLSTCSVRRIASDWGVPVPFPTDNYVADKRTNSYDSSVADGPHVEVSSTKVRTQTYDGARLLSLSSLGDVGLFESKVPPPGVIDLLDMLAVGDVTKYLDVPQPVVALSNDDGTSAHVYTWSYYQSNRVAVIDDLALTAYGKYALKLFAKDYAHNATCSGCVAVVDKFRPHATTKCPASFGDAELTTASVARADALVQDFLNFAAKAENDACSDARCDVNVYAKRSFFESAFTDTDTAAATAERVFSTDVIKSELTTALRARKNPLAKATDQACANQEPTPVAPGACTRCAKLSSALKEYWTDYTCNYEYDVQKCDGDAAQTCAVTQCLVVNGSALATANVALTSAAAKRAKDLGATAATEIRRDVGSGCSKIGGSSTACQVRSRLSDWLTATTSASATSVLGTDSTKFVFWRYRIGATGDWKLWGTGVSVEETETFTSAESKVTVEAWTPCGRITAPFTFSVVLVLPKPSYTSYAASMLSDAAASLANASRTTAAGGAVATALAACAFVALVAVVVQRRRSSTTDATARLDMDDAAYRPLLA